jgi:hypothetical protein
MYLRRSVHSVSFNFYDFNYSLISQLSSLYSLFLFCQLLMFSEFLQLLIHVALILTSIFFIIVFYRMSIRIFYNFNFIPFHVHAEFGFPVSCCPVTILLNLGGRGRYTYMLSLKLLYKQNWEFYQRSHDREVHSVFLYCVICN